MFKTHHIICTLWATIVILAITLSAHSSPVDENEVKKIRECKAYCGSCGCIGFYCGEECICECNEEKNDDTECIGSIQASAKKNKVPFEILIQGPSGNRFLRNALQFEQNPKQCDKDDTGRSKRSTVVIYKPETEITLDPNGYCEKPLETSEDQPRQQLFRGRRAVDGEPWFTDFSNTLVKPAPIPGRSINTKDLESEEEETKLKVKAKKQPKKVTSTTEPEELLPKIRGKIKNTLNRDAVAKEVRKTVKKIENKTLKTKELDETAKKIRGVISHLRSKAEDILLPSSDEREPNSTKSSGKTLLDKLRGRILRTFGDHNDLEDRRGRLI